MEQKLGDLVTEEEKRMGDENVRRNSRVRETWSVDEDKLLGELVNKLGPRNWSVIASKITGRTGKSCRLRWCNQLDPSVMRYPFTEEEDGIIIAAHTIHGNKWAAIAKLLPGRTDNSIKNHWNSKLSKGDLSRLRPHPNQNLKDEGLDRSKASSEETLSYGGTNTFKAPEIKRAYSKESMSENREENRILKEFSPSMTAQMVEDHPPSETAHPKLSRPVPRVGAFNVVTPQNGSNDCAFPRPTPMQGPLIQVSKPDLGLCKLFEGFGYESVVPNRCGHGCGQCSSVSPVKNSLLGPEFVEYDEPPLSSHELTSIATDLNNIGWIRSGIDNAAATRVAKLADATSHDINGQNNNFLNSVVQEGQNGPFGVMTFGFPGQMPVLMALPTYSLSTQVEGFS